MTLCPVCEEPIRDGAYQANWCAAFTVAAVVRQYPKVTGAEIARLSGMAYERVVKAIPKTRELNLIYVDSDEPTLAGHRRYRFIPANRPEHREELEARHREQVREWRR